MTNSGVWCPDFNEENIISWDIYVFISVMFIFLFVYKLTCCKLPAWCDQSKNDSHQLATFVF